MDGFYSVLEKKVYHHFIIIILPISIKHWGGGVDSDSPAIKNNIKKGL
jgi:hypothetical protein